MLSQLTHTLLHRRENNSPHLLHQLRPDLAQKLCSAPSLPTARQTELQGTECTSLHSATNTGSDIIWGIIMHNLPLSLSHLFKHPLLINALEEAAKPALSSSSRDKKKIQLQSYWDCGITGVKLQKQLWEGAFIQAFY